jgi:hypothetical protein
LLSISPTRVSCIFNPLRIKVLLSIAAGVSLALGLFQDFGTTLSNDDPPVVDWVEGVAIMIAILSVAHASNSIVVVTHNDRRIIKNPRKRVEIHQNHVSPKLFTSRCVYDLTVLV